MSDTPDIDIQFYQLVLSLQAQAWQSMGKVASPMTGKVERNLEQAKFSIDMIEMLDRKSKGNLSEDEKKLIDHALYELRLNYVEELKKGDGSAEDDKPEKAADSADNSESAKPENES